MHHWLEVLGFVEYFRHSPNLSFTDNELSAPKRLPKLRQIPNKKSRKTGFQSQQIAAEEITNEDFSRFAPTVGMSRFLT
jgi:hypothetical protein